MTIAQHDEADPRRLAAIRAHRARLAQLERRPELADGPPRPDRITVSQLAGTLGQSEGATRKLLAADQIPGARRIDPRSHRSPWLIPRGAGERYLARFEGGAS